jgi:hypothetical protein
MISTFARVAGPVVAKAGIIVLTGIVFHGLPGRWQNTQPSVTKGCLPLNCTLGTCNSVNFTILKPLDWEQGLMVGIKISGKGYDPSTLLHFKVITITHEGSSYQVFHSFYEEMRSEFPISVKTKNLFLSLAESIAQTLNVTSCYVCGGNNMGDHWPWEARELDPRVPFNVTAFPNHRKSVWLLKTSIIGNYCISCPKGQFSTPVGNLTCLGQKFYNDTAQETQCWGIPNYIQPQPHLLANFSAL